MGLSNLHAADEYCNSFLHSLGSNARHLGSHDEHDPRLLLGNAVSLTSAEAQSTSRKMAEHGKKSTDKYHMGRSNHMGSSLFP